MYNLYRVDTPSYLNKRLSLLQHRYGSITFDNIKFLVERLNASVHREPAILFLHLGNPEGENLHKNGVTGFAFAADMILKEGGRVIFYTGGNRDKNYDKTSQYLKEQGYKESYHFILKTVNEIEESLLLIPRKKLETSAVTDFFYQGDIYDLLAAIDILIQGYLAVRSPEQFFGLQFSHLSPEVYASIGSEEAYVRTQYENVMKERFEVKVSENRGWFYLLREEVDRITADDISIIIDGNGDSPFVRFWNFLRWSVNRNSPPPVGCPESQEELTSLLQEVYNENNALLERP